MSPLKKLVVILPFFIVFLEVVFSTVSLLGSSPKISLTLFMMFWMVSWWVFEILPLGITALIPMFFLPFFNIIGLKQVTPLYSNPVIYLFLGGFIIARGLEKTQLNERIALKILHVTGRSDSGIIIGFISATTLLSMWISNTATTVMMVPIALSVMNFLEKNVSESERKSLPTMSVALFLSIAYSANIGGVMTPIGTPPNVVFIGYLDEIYSTSIAFWKWMLATVPAALCVLLAMFFLLKKLFPYSVSISNEFRNFIAKKNQDLGAVNSRQKITLTIFSLVCLLWVFKGLIHHLAGANFLNDTSIAILGGVLLFTIPTDRSQWSPVLSSDDISQLPWNIVLLFGGGMALAGALKEAGLIQMTTEYFSALNIESKFLLVGVLACVTLFLTEIMSNVALCIVALPVIMNLGMAQGLAPILIGMPAAICASFAFSLPISTPPNAIVFGTNQIKVSQMLRAGIILNLIGVAVVMSVGWLLITSLF